jgi:hypothetical protein
LITLLSSVSFGSLTAACRNYPGVRCVPISAPYIARFSVRYRGNLASASLMY